MAKMTYFTIIGGVVLSLLLGLVFMGQKGCETQLNKINIDDGEQPLTAAMHGMEIYENSIYHFSINYPKGWLFTENENIIHGDGHIVSFYEPSREEIISKEIRTAFFAVFIWENPSSVPVKTWLKEKYEDPGFKIQDETEMVVNGNPAVRREVEVTDSQLQVLLFVSRKDSVFQISLYTPRGAEKSRLEEYIGLFDRVIKSLRFSDIEN